MTVGLLLTRMHSQGDCSHYETAVKQLTAERDSLREEISKSQNTLASLQALLKDVQQQLAQAQSDASVLKESLTVKAAMVDEVRARLSAVSSVRSL